MRIVASVVTKDEATRFLASSLEWNSQWWDELFVWDDRSSDDTIKLCEGYTDNIEVRPEACPSFMEDEGGFRSAGWQAMADRMKLTDEDFVMSFDADEFLVSENESNDLYAELHCRAVEVRASDRWSSNIAIPQLWSTSTWSLRTDGYWGSLELPKLIRWRDGWEFHNKKMGCGSGPKYTYRNPLPSSSWRLRLLHFGHALDEDRHEKYERYTSLENHGHNPKHISSIPQGAKTFVEWHGQKPEVYRPGFGIIPSGVIS